MSLATLSIVAFTICILFSCVTAINVGVVLSSFLPIIPGLIEQLGGGDPIAIAASINVGAHLVDVSPLSTLGAICIASAPTTENRTILFNKLLAWGLSMSAVGVIVCYIFFGIF